MNIIKKFINKTFSSNNEQYLRKVSKIVKKINSYEKSVEKINIKDFKIKTKELKNKLKIDKNLDNILPIAFSYVREVSKRILNMRHFDVQLIGGIALHQGKISEMRTGEGKTLVSTLPAYLNALNKSVFIITVNDYLSNRDAEWMRPVYETLGLSVGVIHNNMNLNDRKAAYDCNIVYGTNNEFGFDYLRDNMVFSKNEQVQKEQKYAIIDEVDSILIDEARTPLVISGTGENNSETYKKINNIIPFLKEKNVNNNIGEFKIDRENKQVFLTESGHKKIEDLLFEYKLIKKNASLYDAENIMLMYYVYSGLRAHHLFKKNIDYIVKKNQIIIVDEHTGRTMPGRRWSDGLHQSLEAKENVKIHSENQTLASITFQNYFKLYDKLSGMTGTADTEAYELKNIYNLDVVVIPTNRKNRRIDYPDLIYMSFEEKLDAIVEDIKDCVLKKRPVLVGTVDISTSEYISRILKKHKIIHSVLNAKMHEKEAEIIAEAGRPGKVTIATNMAGRGTDIVLGGNIKLEISKIKKNRNNKTNISEHQKKIKIDWFERNKNVIESGGLHVIGTERHESRRIDNQLRGRSARQGDPGTTRFYLSVKDRLMKIFISKKVSSILSKIKYKTGESITHSWVSKSIENAQKKVENHHFETRKQLLDFDNVSNEQRKIIYKWRENIIRTKEIELKIIDMINLYTLALYNNYLLKNNIEEEWDIKELEISLYNDLKIELYLDNWIKENADIDKELIVYKINQSIIIEYKKQIKKIKEDKRLSFQKTIILNTIDNFWKEHLSSMESLRQTIHLRGYAQKDPKNEYKKEGFKLFESLSNNIRKNVVQLLMHVNFENPFENEQENINKSNIKYKLQFNKRLIIDYMKENMMKNFNLYSPDKIGRNDPCICGSGKKFKHCHGKI